MAKNKTYGQSNLLSASEKEKRAPKFLRSIFESPSKKSERVSTASNKAKRLMSDKISAAESNYARDKSRGTPGKMSEKMKMDRMVAKKRSERFDPTKIKAADKKESLLKKFKSSKTLAEFAKKIKNK
jgi:hypothetical protein